MTFKLPLNLFRRKKTFRVKALIAIFLILILVFGFFIVRRAFGVTRTWDGGGDTGTCGAGNEQNWSCAQNWSGDTAPGSADLALFDGTSDEDSVIDAGFAGAVDGVQITANYDGTITQSRSLTITDLNFNQAGGEWDGTNQTLDINDGSFTVSGGVHTATTGTWTVEENFTYSGGTLTMTGATISMNGGSNRDTTFTCSGTLGGTVTVAKTSSLSFFTLSSGCTVSATISTSLIEHLTINGTMNVNSGSFDINDGSLIVNNGGTLTYSGSTITVEQSVTKGSTATWDLSGKTLTLDGGSNQDATLTCTGSLGGTVNIAKTSSLSFFTLSSACIINATFNSSIIEHVTINGSMTISSGSLDINDGGLTINSGGTVSYSGSAISINGNFTQNGRFDLTGKTVTLDNSGSSQPSTVTCTGNLGGILNIAKATYSGADVTISSGCIVRVGSINNDGPITVNGTMYHTGSTFNMDSDGSAANLTIASTGAIVFSGSNVTINGNLTVNSGAVFDLTGKTITFDNNGSNQASTVTCSGTLGGTINIAKATYIGGNFTLASGCIITVGSIDTDGGVTVNGTMNHTGSTFTLDTETSSPGTISIGSTGIIAYSGTDITLSGSLTFSGGGKFDLTGKTLTFDNDGSSQDSTLTCNGVTIGGNITINKPTFSNTFTIGSDCTIVGNLTRTAGTVNNPSSAKTLNVRGNFSMSSTDTFGGSNLTLTMGGGSNQTITQNAGTMAGHFSVSKTGGTASLSTSFRTGHSCRVIEGNFDLNGNLFNCGGVFSVEGADTTAQDTTSNLYADWKMDENSGSNVADSSGNNRDATATGTTVVTGRYDDARSFNGTSSDYISGPTGAFGNFTNGFTVSLWAYPTSSGSYARFIDFSQGQADDNILFARNSTTSDLTFEVYNNTTTGGQVTATGVITNSTWQHLVATVDSLGNVNIYKNGTLVAGGKTAVPQNVTRDTVYIGRSPWAADAYYQGYMDELRIYSRALTEKQVQSLYNTQVNQYSGGTLELFGSEPTDTPVLSPGSTVKYTGDGDGSADSYGLRNWTYGNLTIAMTDSGDSITTSSLNTLDDNLAGYWKNDDGTGSSSTDSSGNSNTGTLNLMESADWTSTRPPLNFANSYALDFDGSNEYVSVNDHATLDISGNISLSAWIYPRDTNAESDRVVSKEWSSDNAPWSVYSLYRSSSAQTYNFWLGFTDSTNTVSTTTSSAPLNQWTHITGTYDGSTLKIYFNGKLEDQDNVSKTIQTNNIALNIGRNSYNREYSNMIIDDVRIYSKALTAAEVSLLSGGYDDNSITTLDINGSFTLVSGTFSAPATMTIGGNFTRSGGTFTNNSGTVTFDDATQTSNLSGSTTFYNLTSTTGKKNIVVESGSTQTVSNNFTLTGTAGNRIVIKGSAGSSQWDLIATTPSVSYVEARDSDACGGTTVAAINSIDLGNNSCWTFSTQTDPNKIQVQRGVNIRRGTTIQRN